MFNKRIGERIMKTKDLVIYCIFVAGVAIMYGTHDEVTNVAAKIDGAKVAQVDTFADMI